MAELALAPRQAAGPTMLCGGLAAAAATLFAIRLALPPTVPGDAATAQALSRILLWHSTLPRAATALLAGATLGLAGAMLQRVLRNPIADPSTLGVASGAQLALSAAMVLAPSVLAFGREAVAFAGGLAAVAVVLALAWPSGLAPVTVAVAGMTLALMASALSATIALAHGEYVLSLFVWGAGSLHQQSWGPAASLALHLAGGGLAAALLLRPLLLLGLDDASARGLGLALRTSRVLVIVVAVWLSAGVTAEVGIIGFIGLAAPALARLGGVTSPRRLLLVAPPLGALLLWLTDGLVQLTARGASDAIPTGAAAGLIGGPLLLWLLPRLPMGGRPLADPAPHPARRLARPGRALAGLAAGGLLLAAITLVVGRTSDGWSVASGDLLAGLLPFRAPRVLSAAAAGALLAAAGALMQRLTGNPLAGPEVLGVNAGAGVGLCATLMLVAAPGPEALMAGTTLGALAAIAVILLIAGWTGFGPERLLLAGIALGAFCLSLLTAVLASGDRNAFTLLIWMAGSTDRTTLSTAAFAAAAALVLIAPLPLLARWLDLLPLGTPVGGALGLSVRRSRFVLALAAAAMAALASLIVGPLSLVGLVGPHLALLLGFARGGVQLIAAALIGAVLMLAVDWLGRTIAFPYQIPTGLLASLVGGPYLLWLLRRGGSNRT